MAREVILRLDREQENRPLSQAEAGMQASLKRRCLGLSSLERTMARQRARIRQLREGDANTRYFHVAARGKRKQLFIPALDLGDRTAASQEELEQAVFDHFLYVFGRAPPVGLLSTSGRSATSRRTSQRLTCLSPRRKYGRRSKIGQVIERRGWTALQERSTRAPGTPSRATSWLLFKRSIRETVVVLPGSTTA